MVGSQDQKDNRERSRYVISDDSLVKMCVYGSTTIGSVMLGSFATESPVGPIVGLIAGAAISYGYHKYAKQ